MTDFRGKLSRRSFVKALGLGAALPALARVSAAQETTGTTEAVAEKAGTLHRVMTANILATLSDHDGTPIDWETNRKDVCITVLKNQKADVIGLQEVLRSQYEDFVKAFPEFHVFGYEGPYMDTNPKRFLSAKNVIMYSRERYELTSAGNYWFSDEPLVEGSNSFGERLGRHVNWVRLKDKNTGTQFRVLNTHFAVGNTEAQEFAAQMINEDSSQYQKDFPQLLMGDFNANDTTLTVKAIKRAGWKDTYEAVHGDKDAGWSGHGYGNRYRDPDATDVQIDWIFYRGKVKPVAAKVIRDKVNDLYPSDHFFVSADVYF